MAKNKKVQKDKQLIVGGPLQREWFAMVYSDSMLYIITQSGIIIRSTLDKPNKLYMF